MRQLSKTQEIAFASELVGILSLERSTEYKPWLKVGLCLGNMDKTLFNDWIAFSKKCPEKYKYDHCQKIFDAGYKYDVGIGSLCVWAEEDNPKQYKYIRSKYYYFGKKVY
jgi:hypothetical protein